MHKIPTLFLRQEDSRLIGNMPNPECAWVFRGEGTATRKVDGINVQIRGGVLYKRRKQAGSEYTTASYIRAERDNPADRWIFDALDRYVAENGVPPDGTYEACGPKIQGNPEKKTTNVLISIDPVEPSLILADVPRSYTVLHFWLRSLDIEGVVFHHRDGRKAKLKKRDFGLRR